MRSATTLHSFMSLKYKNDTCVLNVCEFCVNTIQYRRIFYQISYWHTL